LKDDIERGCLNELFQATSRFFETRFRIKEHFLMPLKIPHWKSSDLARTDIMTLFFEFSRGVLFLIEFLMNRCLMSTGIWYFGGASSAHGNRPQKANPINVPVTRSCSHQWAQHAMLWDQNHMA
jgi:hypothetical protein